MNSLMPFARPIFYTPKNLGRNALNPNNLKPGVVRGVSVNALNPAFYSQSPYWASEGASVNAGNVSDAEENDTMDVTSMTSAQQAQAMADLSAMSKAVGVVGLGPIGPAMAVGKGMISLAQHFGLNADTPGPDAGGTNPGPGTGGPSASSPAGGAQAAGGHAPGTGTPGDPGQGGGDGGDGGGDTVICTELRRQGLMPQHIWEADKEFGLTVDPDVRAGYLVWGLPVVRLMRMSKAFTKFVRLFAKPWSEHMAYEMGAIEKDNPFGRLLMKIGVPVCRAIGVICRTLSQGVEMRRELAHHKISEAMLIKEVCERRTNKG